MQVGKCSYRNLILIQSWERGEGRFALLESKLYDKEKKAVELVSNFIYVWQIGLDINTEISMCASCTNLS